MINLFREKRADMFKKKGFLKNILNAIGETAFPVVGILSALNMQGRNEEKKTQVSVMTSIEMLKADNSL